MTELVRAKVYSGWRVANGVAAPHLLPRPPIKLGDWSPAAPDWMSDNESVFESSSLNSRITINGIKDIVGSRQSGRLLAQGMKFSSSRITLITTAISELARNIVLYAGFGEIVLSQVCRHSLSGVEVTALDAGPGIENVQRVLAGGFSTSGGLGIGLSGLKRVVDEFRINSQQGRGTRVIVTVWSQSDVSPIARNFASQVPTFANGTEPFNRVAI